MSRSLTVLRYSGGKSLVTETLASKLPKETIHEYREPFVGGGSMFLYMTQHYRNRFKTTKIQRYWINDLFTELISFWKTIKSDKHQQFINDLLFFRNSCTTAEEVKELYLRIREQQSHDEYLQAVIFYFLNRVSFSGTTMAGGFSSDSAMNRFKSSKIKEISKIHEILERTDVRITNHDYLRLITKSAYDELKNVFIYLDPPYVKTEKLYGRNGETHKFDHAKLADDLKHCEHKFLLTYDDCELIRTLYNWANLAPLSVQYGMSHAGYGGRNRKGDELIITNY